MCFFFQAEDGIRYGHVTGVQTCALPIYENLDGVRSSFAGARVTSTVGKYLTLGLRGDVRTTSNDIFVGADSTFSAIDPYQTVSATGWIALDTPLLDRKSTRLNSSHVAISYAVFSLNKN